MEVVGCFIIFEGSFLLLLRQDEKPQGNTWGIPAGKRETGESLLEAIKREVLEEAGINIAKEDFIFQKTFEFFHDTLIQFHTFLVTFGDMPEVNIDIKSHKDFLWCTPQEALNKKDLIQNLDICIEYFIKNNKQIGQENSLKRI